jgi:hypothetical protein
MRARSAGGVGKESVSGGAPAGSGIGEDADDQLGFVKVVDGADGARVAGGLVLGAAVRDAGIPKQPEGDGVAAGFGEEVAAVTEHVRPSA